MKIAHFGILAPNQSGQYATIKDLVQAERKLGVDAGFIHSDQDGCTNGLNDGNLSTKPLSWATDADWLFRHSIIPKEIEDLNIPTILALHGRPENSFLLEHYGKSQVISEALQYKADGYITFWPLVKRVWEKILGKTVHCIPPPVDFDKYKPEGKKYKFKNPGNPNVIICDAWREDITPFNIVMAFSLFKDRDAPDAKLHIFGCPETPAFLNLKKQGYLGDVLPRVKLETIYRAADMLITPHNIATRTVREALASGCVVVGGTGNRFTPWTADPRDINGYAITMDDCGKKKDYDTTYMAKKHFSGSAERILKVLDEIGSSI